jgi:folate-binding protein YgfZ
MPSVSTEIPSKSDASLIKARDGAVLCDLGPLRVLSIAGPDAATLLQGQLSADVVGLGTNACRHASLNSPKGRMLANFVIWRDPTDPERLLALVPADIAPSVAKRLSMYILRSKVKVTDASDELARLGVGGPGGGDAIRAALGEAPLPFELRTTAALTTLGLPGPRYVVVAPLAALETARADLLRRSTTASYDVWQWLTIRAGVPVITAATQDHFVAQTANWDALGGIDFQKGCYTGQEIIARTQYLGRLKERSYLFHASVESVAAGERLYSTAFGDQACGTVVNAARAPSGGFDCIAVLQIAAAERGDVRLGKPDGPMLASLPLPYALPAAAALRGR